MIYLRTGANGTGKTLLTLRDVREKSIKENRPVYHNGRFEIKPGGPLEGWQKIEFKDWQSVPDGAIFIIDECHNELPVRPSSAPVPEPVKMLAEHRRRGFDFYLITQHPMNLDPFVRRLIGAPGWHQHLKRVSGAPLVSVLEWAGVNDQPQRNGSGASAAVKMVPYPKEVYDWYISTSLDTAKVKIPFQVKVFVACLILVPALIYYGWQSFKSAQPKSLTPVNSTSPAGSGSPGQIQANPDKKVVLTSGEYAASYQPRLEGLAYTAPRYDESTKPVTAPYPAACVAMANRCDCYTQQATKLQVPASLCREIVKGGFFVDWQQAVIDAYKGRPVQADAAPPSAYRPAEPDFSTRPSRLPSFSSEVVATAESPPLDDNMGPLKRRIAR